MIIYILTYAGTWRNFEPFWPVIWHFDFSSNNGSSNLIIVNLFRSQREGHMGNMEKKKIVLINNRHENELIIYDIKVEKDRGIDFILF